MPGAATAATPGQAQSNWRWEIKAATSSHNGCTLVLCVVAAMLQSQEVPWAVPVLPFRMRSYTQQVLRPSDSGTHVQSMATQPRNVQVLDGEELPLDEAPPMSYFLSRNPPPFEPVRRAEPLAEPQPLALPAEPAQISGRPEWVYRISVSSYVEAEQWPREDLALVVTCTTAAYDTGRGRESFRVPVEDLPSVDLSKWFEPAAKRISAALASHPNARVLVHCIQGRSRSPAVTAAFFIIALKLPAHEAIELARSRKTDGTIHIRQDFVLQLEELARQLGVGPALAAGRTTRSRAARALVT